MPAGKRKQVAPVEPKNAKKAKVAKVEVPVEAPAKTKQSGVEKKPMKKEAPKKVDEIQQKIDFITNQFTLKSADGHVNGGDATVEIVKSIIGSAFPVFAEDRSDFVKRSVEVAETAFFEVTENLKKVVAEKQAFIESAPVEKEKFEAAIVEIEESKTSKEGEITAFEEKLSGFEGEKKAAFDESHKAEKEFKDLTKKFDTAVKDATYVEEGFEFLKGLIETGFDTVAKKKKDEITKLKALMKKIGADDSLFASTEAVFNKAVDARGDFDKICVDAQVEGFKSFIEKQNEFLATRETEEAASKDVIAKFEAELETATKNVDECEESLKGFRQELKEIKKDLTLKKKELDTHVEDTEVGEFQLGAAKDEETEFSKVFDDFTFLLKRTNIVEEKETDLASMSASASSSSAAAGVVAAPFAEENAMEVEPEVFVDAQEDAEMAPVVEEAVVEEEAAPVVEEAAPVEEFAAELVVEEPVVEEFAEEAAPVVEEVVEEAAPVVEEAAPVEEFVEEAAAPVVEEFAEEVAPAVEGEFVPEPVAQEEFVQEPAAEEAAAPAPGWTPIAW